MVLRGPASLAAAFFSGDMRRADRPRVSVPIVIDLKQANEDAQEEAGPNRCAGCTNPACKRIAIAAPAS